MLRFGLDVGINSVGFALIEDELHEILCMGAHLFDRAENPKDGSSLALHRRIARQQRRRIHRTWMRKQRIGKILKEHGIPLLFTNCEKTPWELRRDGLDRLLIPEEWGRVLYHLNKRRGFQSTRKDQTKPDKDSQAMLKGASQLEKQMLEAGCRTIGEYLAGLDKQRNGNDSYEHTVLRRLVKEEVQALFQAQRTLGNPLTEEALENVFIDVTFYQRPLKSVYDMLGNCSLMPHEKRAARYSRSAELFVLWQKINHLKILSEDGNEYPLSEDAKLAVYKKAHELVSGVKYSHIRKIIGEQPISYRFNGLYYGSKTRKKKTNNEAGEQSNFLDQQEVIKQSEDKVFAVLPGFHMLKVHLLKDDQALEDIDIKLWDTVATILSFEQDPTFISKQLKAKTVLSEEVISTLLEIESFKGTVSHCEKVLQLLLPHLKDGMTYDKAIDASGLQRPMTVKKNRLPKFEDTRNPIVNRALAQSRKVINAVISRYGIPDTLHVELARDLSKTFEERKEIEKNNQARFAENEHLKTEALGEFKRSVDLLKYRLWKEQQQRCVYSGKYIKPDLLLDNNETQIDHILPYRLTFDDSYNNKVLCLTSENNNKRRRTPYEYFQESRPNFQEAWDQLLAQISCLPYPKRRKFLVQKINTTLEKQWKERHLNDTRYIARLLKNHIETYLDFSGSKETERKRRVICVNGAVTWQLRRWWGLPKNRAESAKHHAMDASVIACTSESQVQAVTDFDKYKARAWKQEVPKPWDTFTEDILTRLESVFVSRLPNRKMSGALHEDTLRSFQKDEIGYSKVVQKIKLSDLDIKKLENLVDKDRNRKLYMVLKTRLEAHEGNAKKAFAEPIYMPVNDPNKQGPLIKGARIYVPEKSGVEVNRGDGKALASNSEMARVDVFEKNGKFYLCPIYTWDVYHKVLPTKLIVALKPENQWLVVDDSYTFKFSLFKNDFIRLVDPDGTIQEGYYNSVHRGTGQIIFYRHDQVDGKPLAKGAKTLKTFDKYVVNVFGERFLVVKEKRLGLANPSRPKRRNAEALSVPIGMLST